MGQKESKEKPGKMRSEDHSDATANDTPTVSTIPDLTLPWSYSCNECGCNIPGTRYTCPECPHYDLCPKCFNKGGHEHELYKEDLHPQRIFDQLHACPTSGQALLAVFKLYAHRKAFGYREPLKEPLSNSGWMKKSMEAQIEQETSELKVSVSLKPTMDLTPLNPFKWLSFKEVGERVRWVGNGLRTLIEPRSFAAIVTHVQLGEFLADYACQIHSIVCPVLGPTLSTEAFIHIINSTKMSLVFCSKPLTARFLEVADSCPSLKFIIQLEPLSDYQMRPKVKEACDFLRTKAKICRNKQEGEHKPQTGETLYTNNDVAESSQPATKGESIDGKGEKMPEEVSDEDLANWKKVVEEAGRPLLISLDDLMNLGTVVKDYEPHITPPDELETLVYTSGSTGIPKGAMFTAKAWHGQLCFKDAGLDLHTSVTWSISDRKNDYRHLYFGGSVAIYNGDMARIFEDIQEIRPQQVNATPAFWNKIYADFKAALAEDTEGLEPLSKEYKAARWGILEQFSKILGGRVEKIVTGGAPTSPEVLAFLYECFACRIRESYGTTECGGIVSAGLFLPGIEWKLIDWEEYKIDDQPNPRGELCIRRKAMMLGYFGDQENTQEAMDSDGYYHTGDIVELNFSRDGADIIDRKKNIFKLSQGEYVAPAKIEKALLGHSPFVKQIFVYGDSFKSSLVAVIVPHRDRLLEYLQNAKESTSSDAASSSSPAASSSSPSDSKQPNLSQLSLRRLCALPQSNQLMIHECARIGKLCKFRTFENPAAVVLHHEEFTKENGLHTQSEKPARHALLKYFKAEIETLYAELDSKHSETKAAVYKLLGNVNLTNNTVVIPQGDEDDKSDAGLTFVQMGGDSLTAIKLRNMIKKNFDVNLPVDVLLNPNTDLAKIASYIDDSKRSTSPGGLDAEQFAAPQVDLGTLMKDARLDADWKPVGQDPAAEVVTSLSKVKYILVTGCTGFLGTALLAELLKSTTAVIYCLVRPRSKASRKSTTTNKDSVSLLDFLTRRLSTSGLLGPNPLKLIKKPLEQRIEIYEGELDQPHFGLKDDVWSVLAEHVQIIYHAGAYVNSVLPYHRLAPSNVEGTRTCIELCTLSKDKLLVYVSTSGVTQASKSRSESPLDSRLWHISADLFRIGGYNLSKYISELLVWEAIDRKFPCLIVRPGFIGAASSTGFANDNDFDNRLLIGLTKLNVAPDSTSSLITMPVDHLCKIVVNLIEHPEHLGSVFHLVNNSSEFTLQVLVDALKASGYPITKTSYQQWQRTVQEMEDETNPIFTMVDEYFSRPYFHTRTPGVLPTDKMIEFVKAKTKFKLPPTDHEYVLRWIEWLAQHDFIARPAATSSSPSQQQDHKSPKVDKKSKKSKKQP